MTLGWMYTADEREQHTSRITIMVKGEDKLRKKIVEEVKYIHCAVLHTGYRMDLGSV